jgi:hypothetical protein
VLGQSDLQLRPKGNIEVPFEEKIQTDAFIQFLSFQNHQGALIYRNKKG